MPPGSGRMCAGSTHGRTDRPSASRVSLVSPVFPAPQWPNMVAGVVPKTERAMRSLKGRWAPPVPASPTNAPPAAAMNLSILLIILLIATLSTLLMCSDVLMFSEIHNSNDASVEVAGAHVARTAEVAGTAGDKNAGCQDCGGGCNHAHGGYLFTMFKHVARRLFG